MLWLLTGIDVQFYNRYILVSEVPLNQEDVFALVQSINGTEFGSEFWPPSNWMILNHTWRPRRSSKLSLQRQANFWLTEVVRLIVTNLYSLTAAYRQASLTQEDHRAWVLCTVPDTKIFHSVLCEVPILPIYSYYSTPVSQSSLCWLKKTSGKLLHNVLCSERGRVRPWKLTGAQWIYR